MVRGKEPVTGLIRSENVKLSCRILPAEYVKVRDGILQSKWENVGGEVKCPVYCRKPSCTAVMPVCLRYASRVSFVWYCSEPNPLAMFYLFCGVLTFSRKIEVSGSVSAVPWAR